MTKEDYIVKETYLAGAAKRRREKEASSAQAPVRNRGASKLVGSGEFVRVPRRIIEAILSEAAHKHADILTEPSWNLGYGVACTLKVCELRQLNTCLHNLR